MRHSVSASAGAAVLPRAEAQVEVLDEQQAALPLAEAAELGGLDSAACLVGGDLGPLLAGSAA